MKRIKLISSINSKAFEEDLINFLHPEEFKGELIDIKFSTSNDDVIGTRYSALVIYNS